MSVPDYAAYARTLGLTQALYPAVEAFQVPGVSKSFGWAKLIATGELPVVRLSNGKRGRIPTMVKAVDMAALIYRREQAAFAPRPRVSGGKRQSVPANTTCKPDDALQGHNGGGNGVSASDRPQPPRPAEWPRAPRPDGGQQDTQRVLAGPSRPPRPPENLPT